MIRWYVVTKSTFAPASRGVGGQPVVRRDERLVEDHLERVAQLLAGAGHVVGDDGGLRDHVVLDARVELHVAGLVDLLRGEEACLLLAVGGHHEGRELRRDALLADHQRRERPVDEALVLLGQAVAPLRLVPLQVDRPRVPLLVLPVAVERLGVVEVDLGHRGG